MKNDIDDQESQLKPCKTYYNMFMMRCSIFRLYYFLIALQTYITVRLTLLYVLYIKEPILAVTYQLHHKRSIPTYII